MTKNKIFREPINGFTHLFGAIVSLVGLIVLIIKALISYPSSNLKITSVIIFGVSLIFLYTASSVYHLVNSTDKVIKLLRRLDHSMIFILIAGTYTPICLVVLQGKLRWSIFIAVWLMALAGVLFKMIWFNMPRWLSTMFYILMGWFVVLFINPVSQSISMAGVVWLVLGGVFYTLGGIMYALKWPDLNLKFMGFHEIFHIFILLGSFSHYMCIFKYVI
ncbi:PAQR family membrane homeostasis protein TrhA [Clostridium brassicae]|uniref:Hemolysin III family protein n=1 Tax=Clostridium brassicae TaxID=2999072 RepID=A0ABT4DCX9_9CLOT|nr:hemolysin III family protein [Clostridium brassicae]MCY6960163.1 hemolysin III family protein [Clostridium brassicae]